MTLPSLCHHLDPNSPPPLGWWHCLSSGGTGYGTQVAPAGGWVSMSFGRTQGHRCTRSSFAQTLDCQQHSPCVDGPHVSEGCSMVTGLYWLGWQGEWPRSGWSGLGRRDGLCWSPGLLQPLPDRPGERERVTNAHHHYYHSTPNPMLTLQFPVL